MHKIYAPATQTKKVALQAYYTDASELNNLMISLLGDTRGQNLLEPCVGKGAFIKPLLSSASRIDAVDIDPEHVDEVKGLKHDNLYVQEGDFIDYFVSDGFFRSIDLSDQYDAIICNPPYGLKFSIEYRKQIKRKFPNVYARESYGLFMTFGISLLKQGGRFVFIVPDTFLTSRNHRSLRRFLVKETNISHLTQFDSKRFETVNFGYGSLCIIAGNFCSEGQHSSLSWLDLRKSTLQIEMGSFEASEHLSAQTLIDCFEDGWSCPNSDVQAFSGETKTLGELAECRTGIYTGDNMRFCGYCEENPPRRLNGHPINWSSVVTTSDLSDEEKAKGVSSAKNYVPFIRGGHRLPYEQTASALDWSHDAVKFYRTDKKARLQNAAFYFKRGLAVPMVTSGRLSASLFERSIFDQGVVGVFPHEYELVEFLLVFLNSDQATDLKKAINPTANNSANYIKRIPVPIPNEDQRLQAKEICAKWRKEPNQSKEYFRAAASSYISKEFLTT
jgi:predicted RNA methylase